MLSRALDTHADLDKSKDTEWIHILLSFMKTYVDSQGRELLMHEEDKVEYLSRLVAALKVAVNTLDSGRFLLSVGHSSVTSLLPLRSDSPGPSCRLYHRLGQGTNCGGSRWLFLRRYSQESLAMCT